MDGTPTSGIDFQQNPKSSMAVVSFLWCVIQAAQSIGKFLTNTNPERKRWIFTHNTGGCLFLTSTSHLFVYNSSTEKSWHIGLLLFENNMSGFALIQCKCALWKAAYMQKMDNHMNPQQNKTMCPKVTFSVSSYRTQRKDCIKA